MSPDPGAPLVVGHVNLARGYRGGERQTEILIRELAARGVTQCLVARRGEALAGRMSGVVGLDVRGVRWPFLPSTGTLRGCDVLHGHDGRAPTLAALAARRFSVPFVLTRRIQAAPSRRSLRAYRAATTLVGLSRGVADTLARTSGHPDVRVIPSALAALPHDEGVVAGLRSRYAGRFLMVCAAEFVPGQKGQEHLIAAARGWASAGSPIHVLLLGRGGGEPLFRRLAEGLDNVEFGGFVDNLGDYLAAADALVLPSLHEGLGSVLLDAFDAGLPVVASDIPGVRDVVEHEVTGLLVPPADPAALEAAGDRLVTDAALRRRLAEAARQAAARFTPGMMADRYLALYREMVG